MAPITEPTPERRSVAPEVLVEMARLKGLSDGVVAFALTLLVLDIRIPDGVTPANLPASLAALAPSAAVYLIAFAVIGGAWGSHQRMLGQIGLGDGLLVWYTLLSLLPITLVPAAASLLGDYPLEPVALGVFAANVVAIQLTAALLWRHAGRHGLITTSLDHRIVAGIGRRLAIIALGFVVSIPLALLTPVLAYALWVAVFGLVFTTDWLSWQQASRTVRATIPVAGATSAHIRVRHGAGRLHVDAADEDAALVEGVFGGGVDQQLAVADGNAEVRLAVTRLAGGLLSPRFPWAWGRIGSLDWDLGVTDRIPVALSVEAASGTALLELGDLQLTDLEISAVAASVEVVLPVPRAVLRVRVSAKAGSVELRIPPDVATSVTPERSVSGSVIVDTSRFPSLAPDGSHRTPRFETAATRIEIATIVSAGSISIG
ncbi:MAG TPA: TMEM175 family protein [Candidatus Limnocylindrales bacterium]|jgi:uncharacterized membrane protein